jgi:hypothetical protein
MRKLIAFLLTLLVAQPAWAGFPNGNSGNALGGWSGYIQNSHGPYSQVQASWRIPAITLDPNVTGTLDLMYQWVGVDAAKLIQTGIREIANTDGSIGLEAWYECFPDFNIVPFGGTPKIGDIITSSITCTANCTAGNAGQTWTAVVNDITQNWTGTQTGIACATGGMSDAVVVIETNASAGTNGSIVRFGDIPFTGITFNNVNPSLVTGNELYGFAHGGGASTATTNPSDPNATTDGFKLCWGQGDSGQAGTSGYTTCPATPSLLNSAGSGAH